jgi:predicted DNA-binding antitoxin AbrB/MazE fold protein
MRTIHALYENGVFRPTQPVDLPDRCEVEFEPRVLNHRASEQALDDVYAILAKRYESGETDVSARHDEHQP